MKKYLLIILFILLNACSSNNRVNISPPETPGALSKFLEDSIARDKTSRSLETLEKTPLQAFAVNKKGQSALHLAAMRNRFEVLEELLKMNSPVNLQDKSGDTPLHLAAYSKNKECVELLIKAGADPNIKNNKQETVMHKAAVYCGEEIFNALFLKSDVSALDRFGAKPLHIAAKYQNLVFCELLLKAKVDENPLDYLGNDPLMACLKGLNSNPELEELLISKCTKPDFTNKALETYMHAAATTNKHLAIQKLLDKGAEIDSRDKFGVTPLVRALRNRKKDAARVLVENGASIKVKDNDDRTLLHLMAFWMTEKTVLKTFLESIDVNAVDKKGRSALHEVAYWGHVKNASELIAAGAKLNIQAENGETPLFRAVRKQDLAMVKLLLDCNADLSLKNIYDETVLKVAVTGLNVSNKIVKLLLENKADVNAVNIYQESILHEVVRGGNVKLLEIILSFNPDLSLKDRLEKTALDWAKERKLPKMVELLSSQK